MSKSLVIAALLGGLVVFAWSFVSWSLLPWHTSAMQSFVNEHEVSLALMNNAPVGGLYMMPGLPRDYATMTAEQKKAAEAQMMANMETSRYFFGVVRRRASVDMARQMIYALLFDILAALLVAMLVMKTGGMTYWGKVSFVVTMALAVGIIALVPQWIWFSFPTRWTLVMIADTLVAWLLGGMVIARFVRPAPMAMPAAA
jgi:hypothetical protein